MTQVDAEPIDESTYRVTVTDKNSTSTHEVTVQPEDLNRLGGGSPSKELVEASFRFLLDRERKESIMTKFDLSVIGRFFPEYSERIGDYL